MANHVTELKMFKTSGKCGFEHETGRNITRESINLHIMQMVLAGILAFDIMDRITGEWTIVNTEWAQAFVLPLIHETPHTQSPHVVRSGLLSCVHDETMANREQGKIVLQVKLNRN